MTFSTGAGAGAAGLMSVNISTAVVDCATTILDRLAPMARELLDFLVRHYTATVLMIFLAFFCKLGSTTPCVTPTMSVAVEVLSVPSAPVLVDLQSVVVMPGANHDVVRESHDVPRASYDVPRASYLEPPSPPASPPSPSPERSELDLPRADLLDHDQCSSLYLELLGGNEVPENLPDSLKAICIADTGCGTSMPNHPDQCEEGSIYKCESQVQGAGGTLKVPEKGSLRMPMDTSRGVGLFRENDAILNRLCAYVLIALGRASREQGVKAVMPSWGHNGYFEYPSGVRVTLLNRHVLIVRPIGYKLNPERSPAAMSAVTPDALGIPPDGDFGLYLGGGDQRPGDLESQLAGTIRVAVIDTRRGGVLHDLTSVTVVALLIEAAGWKRCRFVFISIECRTWSSALLLPDAKGNPGKPYRDIDNVLGIKDENGRLPPIVEAHNFMTRAAAAIARSNLIHEGMVIAETPACRREGSEDATPGCERHVHMFDHPSWRDLATSFGAIILMVDQCAYLDDEASAVNTGPKATAMMFIGKVIEAARREFSGKRCKHKHGTHRPLRGVDERGTYLTASTAKYSAKFCAAHARCIASSLGNVAPAEVAALVAGVLQGKRVPKGSVDSQFIHDCFNHGEQRVLEHLGDALSDFEPWMAEEIKRNPVGPCDACLRGRAPRIGPSGQLPQDENMLFMDFYHCNVPAIFTGNTARLTTKHAGQSKMLKSVATKYKSDAPAALELVLSWYNSKNITIKHCHTDCANELRAGGVGALTRKHLIRITTNVAGVSRTNGIEPVHRVGADVVRAALCRARLPLCFHELCWDWFEDGHALKPSREPPHHCSLGILLGKKVPGAYRRPFGLLCYVTIAKRLPSGTLANKYKEQATRCLHMGYYGSESGAHEALGVEKSQAGYICFEPEECCLLYSESVRFIPGCFPGLQRTAGGGWRIPPERIPFSPEALAEKHAETEPEQQNKSEATHTPEQTADDGMVDVEQADKVTIDDYDYEKLAWVKGFPDTPEPTPKPSVKATPSSPSAAPPSAPSPPSAAPPPKAAPTKVIVPKEMWPDYACTENDGEGWTAEVTDVKGKHSRCKFTEHTDAQGKKFYSEWIETSRLKVIGEATKDKSELQTPPLATPTSEAQARQAARVHDAPKPSPTPFPTPSEPEPPPGSPRAVPAKTDPWLVPNGNTLPHEPGADPLKEPTRPQRERRSVERYAPEMLSACYAATTGTGMTVKAVDIDKTIDSLYVDTDGMRERWTAMAATTTNTEGAPETDYGTHVADILAALPEQAQRAACVMADYHVLAAELGATSPQAGLAREVYAAATLDAAMAGLVLPHLDPLYTIMPMHEREARSRGGEVYSPVTEPLDAIFGDAYDGQFVMLQAASDQGLDELALLAKKRSAPDIYSEQQMKGAEWDEPKQIEINKLMERVEKVSADDPKVKHLTPVDTMWTGKDKRGADRSLDEKKGRCVLRGDRHKTFYRVSGEQATAPVVRCTSASCSDAVSALRRRHTRSGDVPQAYLQGDQTKEEQVLARPPHDFRETDERGIEMLWLMRHPLYGQVDAGAIWNRTFNATLVNPRGGAASCTEPVSSANSEAELQTVGAVAKAVPVDAAKWRNDKTAGLGAERDTYDPCVYSRVIKGEDRVVTDVYVDDIRQYWDTPEEVCAAAEEDQKLLYERHKIKWGAVDPKEDYFLGANRYSNESRDLVLVTATTYIDAMDERYLYGKGAIVSKEYPGAWGSIPADERLVKAYDDAVITRTPAPRELHLRFNSIVGSLRHAVKYRPDISAAMDLLGCCLTFPTEELYECAVRVLVYLVRTKKLGARYSKHAPNASKLWALADSNWRETRSTSGFVIFLAGAYVSCCTRRQGCIAMSSTESELVALADCAIELLAILGVLRSIGYHHEGPVEVGTDNTGAWSLCHRYTSAQHTRHIDRKLFKMRELRGAGRVTVKYVPTGDNTADLFTKVLNRQPFEKHRKSVFNNDT